MSNCGSKKKNWSEILEPIWRGQMLSRVNEFRQSLHRKRKPKGKERSLDRGRKTWAGKKRSRVEKHEKKGTGKVTGTLGKKKRIVGVFSNLCFKLSDMRIIRGCVCCWHTDASCQQQNSWRWHLLTFPLYASAVRLTLITQGSWLLHECAHLSMWPWLLDGVWTVATPFKGISTFFQAKAN